MSRVLVPLAQGCEELEAVTLTDILVRGGVTVVTACLDDNRIITASRGMQLIAQTTLDKVKEEVFDLVVLPGGLPGADYLQADERLRSLLQKTVEQGGLAAAICAAPKVLASAGLLDGKRATSYPGVLEQMPVQGMQYLNEAVVQDGAVITSRGPGTAMDFALYLLEALRGKAIRHQVESALVRI